MRCKRTRKNATVYDPAKEYFVRFTKSGSRLAIQCTVIFLHYGFDSHYKRSFTRKSVIAIRVSVFFIEKVVEWFDCAKGGCSNHPFIFSRPECGVWLTNALFRLIKNLFRIYTRIIIASFVKLQM